MKPQPATFLSTVPPHCGLFCLPCGRTSPLCEEESGTLPQCRWNPLVSVLQVSAKDPSCRSPQLEGLTCTKAAAAQAFSAEGPWFNLWCISQDGSSHAGSGVPRLRGTDSLRRPLGKEGGSSMLPEGKEPWAEGVGLRQPALCDSPPLIMLYQQFKGLVALATTAAAIATSVARNLGPFESVDRRAVVPFASLSWRDLDFRCPV